MLRSASCLSCLRGYVFQVVPSADASESNQDDAPGWWRRGAVAAAGAGGAGGAAAAGPGDARADRRLLPAVLADRKSTRLNSSHRCISYAVFCLKKKKRH